MVKKECGQSSLWALILTVSQERTDRTDFLHAGTSSHKLGVASLVDGL